MRGFADGATKFTCLRSFARDGFIVKATWANANVILPISNHRLKLIQSDLKQTELKSRNIRQNKNAFGKTTRNRYKRTDRQGLTHILIQT